MEALIILLIGFLLLAWVVLPIWMFVRTSALSRETRVLRERLAALETTLRTAPTPPATTPAAERASEPPPTVAPPAPATGIPAPEAPHPIVELPPVTASTSGISPADTAEPPPLPPIATPVAPVPSPAPEPARAGPRINWELFMGAKLFAWLGGLAGFLAVAFFVKYSFEHDLIPPEVRVAVGFLLSAALVAAGLKLSSPRYRITAQVLCATGIVSLYAVTFACNAVYHFAFFGPAATFLLMALITAAAFLLAVRMEAQVVALLGMLGGFLTPVLLSTGRDNPFGLFGFVGLLDVGLIAVALRRRWPYLVSLGALGTIATQIGWAERFFEVAKFPVATVICLSFCAVFFAAVEIARKCDRTSAHTTWSAAAFSFVALGFGFYFLSIPALGARPAPLFTFVFLADLFLLALAWRDELARRVHLAGGAVVFVLLAVWTGGRLTDALLPWALAAYLVFALLHTAFPLVLERRRPEARPTWWSQAFPPLALLLMLGPLAKLDTISLLYWPAVLLVGVIAVGLALLSASVIAVGLVLILTLVATGACLFKDSIGISTAASLVWVVGGFSLFFFAAGLFLARRLGDRLADVTSEGGGLSKVFGGTQAQIPAFSALLPFVLLVMMSQKLAYADPSPLFGLALLLIILVLVLTRLLLIDWLPACALAGVTALEYAWHQRLFSPGHAPVVLAWYLVFHALFAVFPFVFRVRFSERTGPWAVAALSGVAAFPLVHRLVADTWPSDYPGVLPALFALPPLFSFVALFRAPTASAAKRLNQLAWFGGATLLFVTLIFPIQFERQWLTLSWALEGVALLWLFHRVPHPGLRATGVVLLAVAFVRLALNPAVFLYHPRSDTPIFNWYLYSYGIVTLCLFAGARLLASPRDRTLGVKAPPLLNSLGTILAFLLLNIEIADYFSAPGGTLTFHFSGNFARDLAYTVGWALFALGLLVAGLWTRQRPARIAALALLGATLLKLFFHDLARLSQLYRVGALVVVAAVAILASFLYQRFVPADREPAQRS